MAQGTTTDTPVSCGTFRLTVHLGERPWAALLQTPYRPWHASGHSRIITQRVRVVLTGLAGERAIFVP